MKEKLKALQKKYEKQIEVLDIQIPIKRKHDSFGALLDLMKREGIVRHLELIKILGANDK